MKIIILDIQLDFMKKTPMFVTIGVFDQQGVEKLKIPMLPVMLFQGTLAVGQRVFFSPYNEETKVN